MCVMTQGTGQTVLEKVGQRRKMEIFGTGLVERVKDANRILIIGPSGSGKGLLSRLLLLGTKFEEVSYADLLSQFSDQIYESPRQKLIRIFDGCLLKRSAVILKNLGDFVKDAEVWWSLLGHEFGRFDSNDLKLIATIDDSTASHYNLVKTHFLYMVRVPKEINLKAAWEYFSDTNDVSNVVAAQDWSRWRGLRVADIFQIEKEFRATYSSNEIKNGQDHQIAALNKIVEVMISEGRTCAQLSARVGEETSNFLISTNTGKESHSNNSFSRTLDNFYGLSQNIKKTLLDNSSFKFGKNSARGALLSGPPGTGKTRLALALATSLGPSTRLIVLSTADLLRAEIGISEKRLKEAFALARASQPSLIFFDELDALFPQNAPIHLKTLLNQLIAEFDNMELEENISGTHVKVFVLAATNFLEKVNKRLLQAGRLELNIFIGKPSKEERFDILRNELLRLDDLTIQWDSFSSDFVDKLASRTEGYTPADLTKMVQDARKSSWSRANKTVGFSSTASLLEEDFK